MQGRTPVSARITEGMECLLFRRVRACRMDLFHYFPEGDPCE